MRFEIGLGKGVREGVSPFRTVMVWGQPFNTPNPGVLSFPLSEVGTGPVFSAADLKEGLEALVCYVNIYDVVLPYTVDFSWASLLEGKVLFHWAHTEPLPPGWTGGPGAGTFYWTYIGVKSGEIDHNGDYFVQVMVNGAARTFRFTITDLPPISTWPALLQPIKDLLDRIWADIVGLFEGVAASVATALQPVFDTVWSWIDSATTAIREWVKEQVERAWGWVQDAVVAISTSVTESLLQVWDWLQSTAANILNGVGNWVSQVYSWIQTGLQALTTSVMSGINWLGESIGHLSDFVATKVDSINKWFSDEFIDPFLDWLLQLPANIVSVFEPMVARLGTRLESWLTHRSPGFPGVIAEWYRMLNDWVYRNLGFFTPGSGVYQGETAGIWALLGMGISAMFTQVVTVIGPVLSSLGPTIGGWLSELFPRILGWFRYTFPLGSVIIEAMLRGAASWFAARWTTLMVPGVLLTLETTGKLQQIIHNYVTPAIVGVFDWFEARGPVAPVAGRDISDGITKLAEFTVSGLAGLTLAGEALSPLKHMGMGHLAAIIYDLVNYKTLTAAFMGVLAAVYIKTPLTYYYNRVARPNIPDERGLGVLRSQYVISSREYADGMAFEGYPDAWIPKIEDTVFRAMTPYMLRSLAEAGLLDDRLLDHALRQAGYDEISIPYIKRMMQNLAATTQAALSTSTAMTRYQEGFDDEATLRSNLTVLGVPDAMLDRYLFAANLRYVLDYSTDLKAFYVDQYHRREIEEPELRSDLISSGLNPDRIDLLVQSQSIKRLKAPAAAEDPALTLQVDTTRDRRRKRLITRAEEIAQLVALGKELSYATAVADNDDVALATAGAPPAPAVVLAYETEAGKVEVDTIRRLRRGGQSTPDEELAALRSLDMPVALAQAIVDNDTLRVKRSTTAGE